MIESIAQIEAQRTALMGDCYRMLGSIVDAEDATQESLIRAWKSMDRFDGRASLRMWLYRIATSVCLDEIASRGRRGRPIEEGEPSDGSPSMEDLLQRPKSYWVEPIADARAIPSDADPAERAILRESIRLAFVTALQHLAPKRRTCPICAEQLAGVVAIVCRSTRVPAPRFVTGRRYCARFRLSMTFSSSAEGCSFSRI